MSKWFQGNILWLVFGLNFRFKSHLVCFIFDGKCINVGREKQTNTHMRTHIHTNIKISLRFVCVCVYVCFEKRTRACVCTVQCFWDWQELTLKGVGTGEWQKLLLCLSMLRVCCSQCKIVLESCFLTVGLGVVYLNMFCHFLKTGKLTISVHFSHQTRDNKRSVFTQLLSSPYHHLYPPSLAPASEEKPFLHSCSYHLSKIEVELDLCENGQHVPEQERCSYWNSRSE